MFEPRVKLSRLERDVIDCEQQSVDPGKILFYGSSGFTRWSSRYDIRPLEDDILMRDDAKAAVNHGFGGATAEELLYYYPRLVRPWKPRALVVSIVHNDRGLGYSPNEILTNLAKLFQYARTDFPGIRLYACDSRPTLELTSDAHLRFQAEFHQLLREYCNRHADTTYVCHIESPLWFEKPEDVGDYRKVRTDIFVEDRVHFNQKGYDLYKEFMKTVLQDLL